MINLLSGIGRTCLGLAGLAIIIGAAVGGASVSNAEPLRTLVALVLGIIVAGAILGPLAVLYRMSDDLRVARDELRSLNGRNRT